LFYALVAFLKKSERKYKRRKLKTTFQSESVVTVIERSLGVEPEKRQHKLSAVYWQRALGQNGAKQTGIK
jgi:hypothetical protein